MGFIRKVFGVLSLQLLVTFGIVALFTFSTPVRGGGVPPRGSLRSGRRFAAAV